MSSKSSNSIDGSGVSGSAVGGNTNVGARVGIAKGDHITSTSVSLVPLAAKSGSITSMIGQQTVSQRAIMKVTSCCAEQKSLPSGLRNQAAASAHENNLFNPSSTMLSARSESGHNSHGTDTGGSATSGSL